MMTVLISLLPVFALLPVFDLPFPLVIVGGVLLAIASNRTHSIETSAKTLTSKPSSQQDAEFAPSRQRSAQRTQTERPVQTSQGASSKSDLSSPSLPNLVANRQRPISPKITPQSSTTEQPETSSSDGKETPAKSPSPSSNPQLPSFVSPSPKSKDRVSFTIENQD